MDALVPWIIYVAIGCVVGFLAGKIMNGKGFGLVGDLVVGVLGMLLGSYLAGLVGLGSFAIVGQILIGVAGACLLLFLLRKFVK